MRARVAALGLACVACRAVYGVDSAGDAGGDALRDARADAAPAPDAPPCTHDEDGDGKLDCVDNCPGMANGSQLDGDHDGVGDACDPFPTIGSDSLVAADFFDVSPTTFIPSSGWTLGSDVLASPAATGMTNTLGTGSEVAPGASVELTLVPSAYVTGSQLDIVIAYADKTLLDCQLSATPANSPLNQIAIATDKQGFGAPTPITPIAVGTPMAIKVTFATNTSTCEINGDTHTGAASASEPSTMATATVSLKAMAGTISYAILYSHAN